MSTLICSFDDLHDNRVLRYCADFEAHTLHMDTQTEYGLKPRIDWSVVESFPFPAPFEEQQYIGDEGEIHVYSWDGRQETTLVGPYSVRELYLEHFGE